jgi:hypothetical protein
LRVLEKTFDANCKNRAVENCECLVVDLTLFTLCNVADEQALVHNTALLLFLLRFLFLLHSVVVLVQKESFCLVGSWLHFLSVKDSKFQRPGQNNDQRVGQEVNAFNIQVKHLEGRLVHNRRRVVQRFFDGLVSIFLLVRVYFFEKTCSLVKAAL